MFRRGHRTSPSGPRERQPTSQAMRVALSTNAARRDHCMERRVSVEEKPRPYPRLASFIKHQVVTDPPYKIVGFGEMGIKKCEETLSRSFNEVWPLRAHRHFDGGRFREMGKRTGGGHRALQPPERIQVRQRLRAFATLPLRVRGGAPCARSNAHPLSCFRDPPSRA